MADDDLRFGDLGGGDDLPDGPIGRLIEYIIQLTILAIVLFVAYTVIMELLPLL